MSRHHVTSTDWQARAMCRSADPGLFVPEGAETLTGLEYVRTQFCDHCPVNGDCLREALSSGSEGYWAGTTTAMRRALWRNRSRVHCPVCSGSDVGSTDQYEFCIRCGSSWPTGIRPEPEKEKAP